MLFVYVALYRFGVFLMCCLWVALPCFVGPISHFVVLACILLFVLVCSSDLTRDSLSPASCTFVVGVAVYQLHGLQAHQLGLLMLSDSIAHNSLHGHH